MRWTAGEHYAEVPVIGGEPHYWHHPDARTAGELVAKLREAGFVVADEPRPVRC